MHIVEIGGGGDQDKCVLVSWSPLIHPTTLTDGLFPDFIVTLVGIQADEGEPWHSTPITSVMDARTIATNSLVYELRGPINKNESLRAGFSEEFVAEYINGFPTNWHTHFLDHVDRMKLTKINHTPTPKALKLQKFIGPRINKYQIANEQPTLTVDSDSVDLDMKDPILDGLVDNECIEEPVELVECLNTDAPRRNPPILFSNDKNEEKIKENGQNDLSVGGSAKKKRAKTTAKTTYLRGCITKSPRNGAASKQVHGIAGNGHPLPVLRVRTSLTSVPNLSANVENVGMTKTPSSISSMERRRSKSKFWPKRIYSLRSNTNPSTEKTKTPCSIASTQIRHEKCLPKRIYSLRSTSKASTTETPSSISSKQMRRAKFLPKRIYYLRSHSKTSNSANVHESATNYGDGPTAEPALNNKADGSTLPNKTLCEIQPKERSAVERNGLFECDSCGRKFSRKWSLTLHVRTHTGNGLSECDICGHKFSHESFLKAHARVHTGERPFKCKFCDKRFSHNFSLTVHLRIHTGERLFGCDSCKKAFSDRSTLRKHLLIHTGERPFKCNICDWTFHQISNLKAHLRTHTGERPYKCAQCPKDYQQLSGLQKHVKLHH